jgi:mycofactocin system transcriptional regulator
VGRRPATTHAELEEVGIRLFTERGYDETSVDDIAVAAGIGRRTFFRYFASKADLVWGDFDAGLARMRARFAEIPAGVSMMSAVRQVVIDFNRLEPAQVRQHRRRLALILGVPTLIANSTLRFAQWREVVADFAAARLAVPADHLVPGVVGHCALGAALAAYEQWVCDEGADLAALLDEAFTELAVGFDPSRRT